MKISGNIVDVVKGEIFPGTVEVVGGIIKRIRRETTSYNTYLLPGFIDAHCHIESSMLCPAEFARLAVVHGTVATISDPHEIANVLGLEGVSFMIENGKQVPFHFYFGAPSCVPATSIETSGAAIDLREIETLLQRADIKYLSEVMNFPGVIGSDPVVMGKIAAARRLNKPIDGHAPGLTGYALKKYIEAGITTDHETFTYEEGKEKIAYGMKVIIREGSAAKNFDVLCRLIEEFPDQCMLCSDDKHPNDLARGHINEMVKKAINDGVDFMKVLKAACLNPVNHYHLDVGLMRIGDRADFIEVDDLKHLNVLSTFVNGEIVAKEGLSKIKSVHPSPVNKFEAKIKKPTDFSLPGRKEQIANVIEAINGQVVTGWIKRSIKPKGGYFQADPEQDILKIAIVCRYADRPPVMGFVKNFGLKKGAIASSVSHDSHNIVAVGVRDEDLCRAVNLVIENKGGLAVAAEDKEEILPLPLAGIMNPGDGYEVADKYASLDRWAKNLGSSLDAPFMTLSFLALPVIPRLKLTDRGLFDVDKSCFISLFD